MTDSPGARGKGYSTPEEAALASFKFARVVRVRESDWDCTRAPDAGEVEVEVELATNEPPMEYEYFVHVHREGDLWFQRLGHN